jgi:hypothetical protein
VVLHSGQLVSWTRFLRSCERRLPVRELLCFLFGTAIEDSIYNKMDSKAHFTTEQRVFDDRMSVSPALNLYFTTVG